MHAPSMASTSQTRLEHFLPASSSATIHPSPLAPPVVQLEEHQQCVYVLCGVVGSGKSTLAVQLEALYPEHYVRICQDVLGTRKKCEDMTRDCLLKGKSALIDRQNFDISQRYTWLEIGHNAGVEVVALVFSTPKQTCADRLRLRTNHETIKSAEQGVSVLNNISAVWTSPTMEEGFHRIVQLPTSLPLRYTLNDVNTLITSVQASPVLPGILPPPPPQTPRNSFFAGRGRGSPSRGLPTPSPGSRNLMSSWLAAGPPTAVYVPPHRQTSRRRQSRSRPYQARGGSMLRGGSRGRGRGGQHIDLTNDTANL